MTGITNRLQAVRERIAQRRAGGASKAERAQSKADRVRKRAQAAERRRDHKRKYGGSGGDGGM